MQKIEQGLVVFGAVILLSFGFPVEIENGSYKGVVGPEASGTQEEKLLSKRKPPAKIPGPKFINEDLQFRVSLQSGSIQRATQTELHHEESKENTKSGYLTEYQKEKPDSAHMASVKNKEKDEDEKDDKEKGKKKEDKDDKDDKGKGKDK